MSSIQVQTPPAQEPITVDLVKAHLRVTISAEDKTLFPLYIQSARETVESESGRSLVDKLYRQSHDRFPGIRERGSVGTGYFLEAPRYSRHHHHRDRAQMIKLLRCPLVKVERIVYIGTDAQNHTLLPAPVAWLAQNEYVIGDQVTDGTYLQEVTAVAETETGDTGESGSSAPTWNATLNGTTTDGDITWTNKGAAPAGDFLVDADSEPPRIFPAYGTFWPLTLRVPNAVQIFFVAGYGNDGAAAPANLKVAVLQTVGLSYEYREAATPEQLRLQDWYERLIWSERVLDYAPTE